jgi:hypothetical protein
MIRLLLAGCMESMPAFPLSRCLSRVPPYEARERGQRLAPVGGPILWTEPSGHDDDEAMTGLQFRARSLCFERPDSLRNPALNIRPPGFVVQLAARPAE